MGLHIFNVNKENVPEESNVIYKSTTGNGTKLGPWSRKAFEAISKACPDFAKKIAKKMDINTEKLTEFWHEHVDSSGVDKAKAKERYDALRGNGTISSQVPKSKIRESIREAGKILDKNGN